jgi:plastocyanin
MSLNQSRRYRAFTRILLCISMALLVLTSSPSSPNAAAKSKVHTVALRGMNYLPATVTVNVGDTVVWKNEDIVPHTATARNKSFDSGSIEPGGFWRYVANKKGTYFYYCAYHPNTKGKLIVR